MQIPMSWGHGGDVMAYLLLDALTNAPMEAWGADLFNQARREIHALIKEARDEVTGPDRKARKEQRKRLERLVKEAVLLLNVLERRLLGANGDIRISTLAYIDSWATGLHSMKTTPKQAGESLRRWLSEEFFAVPSDGVSMALLRGYERGEHTIPENGIWPRIAGTVSAKGGTEDYVHSLMPAAIAESEEKNLILAPGVDPQKLSAAMEKYRNSLSDLDSDLLSLAFVKFAERARYVDDRIRITLDEMMDALHYQKNKSGSGESYRATDKAFVRARFEKLQDGHLSINRAYVEKVKGKNRQINIRQGRVLMIDTLETIDKKPRQLDLDGHVDQSDWDWVTIGFGRAFAYRLFEGRRQVAQLHARALKYNQKQLIEKRILKRLDFYWRLNINKESREPYTRRTVLALMRDDAGDPRLANAGDYGLVRRDAERLEQALDQLKLDGGIGAWRYVDGSPRIDQEGRLPSDWLDAWLDREIDIEAPQALQMFYKEHLKKPQPLIKGKPVKAVTTPVDAGIGQHFRAFRHSMNVSGLKAAEATGIDNTALSRIESGKRKPTEKQRLAMEAWMRDLQNIPGQRADTIGH